jgi:ABC-2 type transport system ATP-binding protein
VTDPPLVTAAALGTKPALSSEALWKRYRRDRGWALADVSLRIEPGRFVALVGPNGAGKSTLMRTWLGFERPTMGMARVSGFDPWAERGRAILELGYIPQTPSLYDELSVAEHVDLAAYLRRSFDREAAWTRIEALGLPARAIPATVPTCPSQGGRPERHAR